ncbi:hypothetical protein P171DRAFT_436547 [Karstenula rhodostoma CBS 690.94]|uniref:Heterokaryon incompatibility domain-containing protein n=1 Tax=Karstenula rhodostoma CBS 690.94 TaxID=1392251 RepID=A0A9P4P9X5_9PLEO|nr:hypothetical protein P171DRAFT_436547 [Karstenula rhodostoma CBS 690.94]
MDTDLPVGRSLYGFLQRISRDEVNFRYWIDALCINQSNDSKKSGQIPLMRGIYTNASRVMIWLGNVHVRNETMAFIQQSTSGVVPQLSRGSTTHANLLSFCTATYWSRVWIVQEIICARNLCIVCENTCLDWNALDHTLKDLVSRPVSIDLLYIT